MSSVSDLFIQGLEPKAEPYDVPAGVSLALTVTPDGEKFWTLLDEQAVETLRQRLGAYPDMTPEAAREAAERTLKDRGHLDPLAHDIWTDDGDASQPLPLRTARSRRPALALAGTLALAATLLGAAWLGGWLPGEGPPAPDAAQTAPTSAAGAPVQDRPSPPPEVAESPAPPVSNPAPQPSVAAAAPVSPVTSEETALALPTPPPAGTAAEAEQKPVDGPPRVDDTHARLTLARVAKAVFTSGIADEAPVDELGEQVAADSPAPLRIFYFTELRHMTGQTVTHRWEFEGRVVAEFSLGVAQDWIWPAYSSMDVQPAQQGVWRVMVLNAAGEIIKSSGFVYLGPIENAA